MIIVWKFGVCMNYSHEGLVLDWGSFPMLYAVRTTSTGACYYIHTYIHKTTSPNRYKILPTKGSIRALSAYMYVFHFLRHRVNCPTASEENFVSLDILREEGGTISEFFFWTMSCHSVLCIACHLYWLILFQDNYLAIYHKYRPHYISHFATCT